MNDRIRLLYSSNSLSYNINEVCIMNEKRIETKRVFEGKLISVSQDIVELDDGSLTGREVVEHPGGVAIAAQLDNGEFLYVTQYRYAAQSVGDEFPAGKLERNENPQAAVLRELEEETGYIANTVVDMGYIDASPAYLEERIYLYYGTHLEYKGQKLDQGEFLSVQSTSLDELYRRVIDNELHDAKTIALILKVKEYLEKQSK